MCSKSQRIVSILASLIASLSPMAHAQEEPQKQRYVYSVKYICGLNKQPLAQSGPLAAAGGYATEINIQRAQNAGEARISMVVSVVRSVFSAGGRTGTSYSTTLVGGEAVMVMCHDIDHMFDSRLGTDFRNGFLQIFSFEPLSVVAVYTAKHCRTQVSARFLRNAVCDGEVALDVVRYDPVLVEAVVNEDG